MSKRKTIPALLVAFSLALATAGGARSEKGGSPSDYVNQTTCPVMGGAIDSTIYTEMQGQRIYFCCPGCIETFRADPEKYFMKAAEDRILFQNVQELCPVTGEPIDKKIFKYYKGRGLYFCCAKCLADFDADPGKYLLNMDRKPDAAGETGKDAGAPEQKKKDAEKDASKN